MDAQTADTDRPRGAIASEAARTATPEAPPVRGPPPRACSLALLLLVLAGIGFRLAQYLSDRSFWEDESFIVLNLREKSAAELMRGLTANQAAPPLFLLAERGVNVVVGGSEFVLRALPLAAGILSLLGMAVLARRTLTSVAALVAVGMFAASDRLVWHAAEVKPYSSDVLAAVLLALAAIAWRREGGGATSPLARLVRTAGLAGLLVWCSYPAVFVFAGLTLALLPGVFGNALGRWRRLAAYVGANLLVVTSFAAVFVLSVMHQQSVNKNDYWIHDFADWSHPYRVPLWMAERLLGLCQYACYPIGPAVLVLAILGGIALWRNGRGELLGILLLPLSMVILAACAHRYPFDGKRVNAFLIPGILLTAGVGVQAVIDWFRGRWVGDAAFVRLASSLLLAIPLALAAYHVVRPRTRAHVRPAAEYVAERAWPGDLIYCDPNPFQFACYWPVPPPPGELWDPHVRSADELASGAPLANRFWLVLAYEPGGDEAKKLASRRAPADAVGTLLEQFHVPGGAAYLFEPRGAEVTTAPATAPEKPATRKPAKSGKKKAAAGQ